MLKVLPFQSSSLGLQNCSVEEVGSLRNGTPTVCLAEKFSRQ